MEQGSDFNARIFAGEMGERIPIVGRNDGRYRLFKTRLYGKLHFEKRVAEEYAFDLLTIEALHKEFVIGYGLTHPGIVRYLRYEDRAVYEEYIDGLSLREMLDNDDPRLKNPDFLRKLCIDLLDVLRYIHSKGVLHLDIKPENVMVSNVGGGIKLIDFGCAKSAEFDSTSGYTFSYMAPEQADGETNTYTDIYLLGRLMEELSSHAGLQRKWRDFVFKATAENVHDRFADDEVAMAAVPGQKSKHGSLMLISLLAIVVLLTGLFLYYLPKEEQAGQASELIETKTLSKEKPEVAEPAVDSAKVGGEDTTAFQRPSSSTSVSVVKGVTDRNPQYSLRNQIEKHIRDRYNSRVFPAVDACDGSGSLSPGEAYDKMSKESVAAQQDAVDFGEALGRKYPKEADYIMNIVSQEVAAQQMKVARRYDKAYERLYGMTQEESREADRIKREEIMEELRKKRRGE